MLNEKPKKYHKLSQTLTPRGRDKERKFKLTCLFQIDEKSTRCMLQYEDNSKYWSLFKDIHRGRVKWFNFIMLFGHVWEKFIQDNKINLSLS